MKMIAYASAGAVPKVHSEIETLRPIKLSQRGERPIGKLHHFGQLLGWRLPGFSEMSEWGNHEMPRRVGKEIEDDEIVDAAKDDEPFGIDRPIFADAEDARRRLLARRR